MLPWLAAMAWDLMCVEAELLEDKTKGAGSCQLPQCLDQTVHSSGDHCAGRLWFPGNGGENTGSKVCKDTKYSLFR